MGYSFEGRIRYSEVGEDGYLTLPGILNYFQDCCIFHSEAVDEDKDILREREGMWVLSAWQVIVNSYPKMGETVVTDTAPYAFKGFTGMRNFTMKNGEEMLAYANTFWTYINVKTGLPQKLVEEDMKKYGISEKLDMEYAPRKIAVPNELKEMGNFAVQKQHLDTNHHVNNSQYVCMAEEFLPEDFEVRQLRVEYKKQAKLGDIIYPKVCEKDEKTVIVLDSEDGQPYAVAEFTKRI